MAAAPPPPPPPPRTRLAILMVDTPMDKVQAEYGSYGRIFKSLFAEAVKPEPLEASFSVTLHDVVPEEITGKKADKGTPEEPVSQSYPKLDDIDAVLITGSKHNAWEDKPWIVELVNFTRAAIDTAGRVKVVGVCFGHQIVGRALGSTVAPTKDWEVSVTEVELTKEGKDFFRQDSIKIQQMHRDIVTSLPDKYEAAPVVRLGKTGPCQEQGMLVPGRAVTVQGHPEFNENIMIQLLNYRKEIIIPAPLADSGLARAGLDHDGVAIARAFVRFLRPSAV